MASPNLHQFDGEGDVTLVLTITSTVEKKSEATKSPYSVEDSNGKDSSEEVKALVSSKQLSAASTVFKDMLGYRFSEGDDLKATGSVQIVLPEDNGDAWLILLAAIHGQSKMIPKEVHLDEFFGLASLIDKYDMNDIAKGCLRDCIRKRREKVPRTSKGFVQAAYINYVLNLPLSFASFTKDILLESDGSTKEIGLLVPDQILAMVEITRQEILTSLFEVVNAKYLELLNSDTKRVCGHGLVGCDSRTLGSIQITLWSVGVALPARAPFKGVIIKNVIEKLGKYMMPDYGHREPWKCERFDQIMREAVIRLKPKLVGIELSEIKK